MTNYEQVELRRYTGNRNATTGRAFEVKVGDKVRLDIQEADDRVIGVVTQLTDTDITVTAWRGEWDKATAASSEPLTVAYVNLCTMDVLGARHPAVAKAAPRRGRAKRCSDRPVKLPPKSRQVPEGAVALNTVRGTLGVNWHILKRAIADGDLTVVATDGKAIYVSMTQVLRWDEQRPRRPHRGTDEPVIERAARPQEMQEPINVPRGTTVRVERVYAGRRMVHVGRVMDCNPETIIVRFPDNKKTRWRWSNIASLTIVDSSGGKTPKARKT